jgi:hypothetical protein
VDADALTEDVWEVAPEEFPSDGSLEAQARFLLRYAVLAPSSHNSRPWRFDVDGGVVTVSADETRWLPAADPDRRELHLILSAVIT